MNLSKTKIAVFFATIIVLIWFLYPREFFLAYIYEGQGELTQAEAYYLKYLKKSPHSKFATLRLANLYSRMARPEKAIPLVKRLYEYRPHDWELAGIYLDYLRDNHWDEALYQAQLAVAENFMDRPRFPRAWIEHLLYEALQYATWQQNYDDAYDILLKLVKVARDPASFVYEISMLDRGLKRTDRLLKYLTQRLKEDPKDTDSRLELASLYMVKGELKKARVIVREGRRYEPENTSLLKLSIEINTRLGDLKRAIKQAKTLVSLKTLAAGEKPLILKQLAYLYRRNNKDKEALGIFEHLLKAAPSDIQLWRDKIDVLTKLNERGALIRTLKEFIGRFDQDNAEEVKTLAHLYLYDEKDSARLPFYLSYVRNSGDWVFALDVASQLIEFKLKQQAENWLAQITTLFPGNRKLLQMRLENLIDLKKHNTAFALASGWLKHHPDDKKIILLTIDILYLQGRHQEAESYLKRYAELQSQNPRALTFVARELYFLGSHHHALFYINRALGIKKTPAAWFWKMEIHHSLGDRKDYRNAAKNVIKMAEKTDDHSPNTIRMALKARGRLGLKKSVIRNYKETIAANPRAREIALDFIDLLLEEGKTDQARREIKAFSQRFPDEPGLIKPYQARLALRESDWETAVRLLKELIREQPNSLYLRRDLAEAYTRMGHWDLAIKEYERIQGRVNNNKDIVNALNELHDEHDTSIFAQYDFTDFGSQDFMKWRLGHRRYLTKNLVLLSKITLGHFNPAGTAGSTQTGEGLVTLESRHLRYWTLGGALGAGFSERRKTPTAHLKAGFSPSDRLNLLATVDLRELRTDFPEAVTGGSLQDRARFTWDWLPWERLVVHGRYEFNRSYLANGAQSYENTIEPNLSFVVLKAPRVTVGYQLTYSRITEANGFFSQVPLVPKMTAHYITGGISHRFNAGVSGELGFFIGEDTARDLRFFKGDLWGANGSLTWRVTDWLNLKSSYNYGRETLTGIAGETHQFTINLTGHWE